MPAVVRVKRRIDEEPLGAFVLNGKKRRLNDDASAEVGTAETDIGACDNLLVANTSATSANTADKDEISTILKFAGTMRSEDDITQLARLTKDEAKQLVQQKSRKPTNLTERARQEMRQSLHENRFRVVNCLRTTLDTEEVSEEPKELTIVDIEKHSNASNSTQNTSHMQSNSTITSASNSARTDNANASLSQPSDSDTGYVYDLYLPENEQQAQYVDLMDDNYLSIRPFDDLIYEDRFNNDDDNEYDSEDSNQENYFGNDYPDEDDDLAMNSERSGDKSTDEDEFFAETEGARELRDAVEKFVLCDDNDDEEDPEHFDQSSDDEDCVEYRDPYVNTIDVEYEDGFVDDVDFVDADRYGMAYARYKARIMKGLHVTSDKDSDDEEVDNSDKDAEERYHSASENESYD